MIIAKKEAELAPEFRPSFFDYHLKNCDFSLLTLPQDLLEVWEQVRARDDVFMSLIRIRTATQYERRFGRPKVFQAVMADEIIYFCE